jgi:hypothetical protein
VNTWCCQQSVAARCRCARNDRDNCTSWYAILTRCCFSHLTVSVNYNGETSNRNTMHIGYKSCLLKQENGSVLTIDTIGWFCLNAARGSAAADSIWGSRLSSNKSWRSAGGDFSWWTGSKEFPVESRCGLPKTGWEVHARLLDRIPGSVSEHHQSRERSETDEQKAEAIIFARLTKLGWGKKELAARRKSRPTEGGACARKRRWVWNGKLDD